MPTFLETVKILREDGHEFVTLLPIATSNLNSKINKYRKLLKNLNIQTIDGNAHLVLQSCDLALVASGTATLEAMLYKKPMVIGYKVSKITSILVRRMLKTKYVGLPNILANKEIVPELLQRHFTAQNCADALKYYLSNKKYIQTVKQQFKQLHQQLIRDSDKIVTSEIIKLLDS